MASIFQPNSSGSAASSAGSKNYLSTYNGNTGNGDFEGGNTTGWSLAHSALTSAFPSTVGTAANAFSSAGGAHGGSAASVNLSITASNSSPIAGTYSGSYASAAASTAGDMLISDAFTIDTEDQAKVLTFKFYYSATSNPSNGNWSGTSSNSFGVAIYDVTNAAWIMPAGVWSMVQSSGSGYATGTFQTTSNSTQYQLAVFNANASAGAITVKFDDFVLGPQTAPFGPAMTDWTSFTPTGSWVTNTTYTGWWKREGDKLSLIIKLALAGAPTTATLTVNLPSGLVIDTTKLPATPANTTFGTLFGTGAAHGFAGVVFYNSTTAIQPFQTNDGNTTSVMNNNAITQASPYTFANADFIYLTASNIPISGWSSNTSMSSDTDTRVVAFRAHSVTATVTSSYSDLSWTTTDDDTHAAYSSPTYTIPVTGFYDFVGQVFVSATTIAAGNTVTIGLFNNTSSTTLLETQSTYQGTNTTSQAISFDFTRIKLNAGTQIKMQIKATSTSPVITANTTENFWCIGRSGGPAVITATESLYASYHFTGTTFTASKMINFDTKDNDTHNAVTTGASWTFTCPVSGAFLVNVVIDSATATTAYLYKNNAIFQTVAGTNASVVGVGRPNFIKCNAGDTLDVRVDSSAAAGAAGLSGTISNSNYISIYRLGN